MQNAFPVATYICAEILVIANITERKSNFSAKEIFQSISLESDAEPVNAVGQRRNQQEGKKEEEFDYPCFHEGKWESTGSPYVAASNQEETLAIPQQLKGFVSEIYINKNEGFRWLFDDLIFIRFAAYNIYRSGCKSSPVFAFFCF